MYGPDTFCLDGSHDGLGSTHYVDDEAYFPIVHYSGLELDQTVILCYNPEDDLSGQEPEVWII